MNKILLAIIALLFIGTGVVLTTAFKNSDQKPDNQTTQSPTVTDDLTKNTGYTMDQVATHSTTSDCYTVIDGAVYNLTDFVGKHPGGAKAIASICGKDGTAAFSSQHEDDRRPNSMLASFKIGVLTE